MKKSTETSETPLLDEIVNQEMNPEEYIEKHGIEAFVRQYNARMATLGLSQCRWEPCSFILFGLAGETHDEYHQRKGMC